MTAHHPPEDAVLPETAPHIAASDHVTRRGEARSDAIPSSSPFADESLAPGYESRVAGVGVVPWLALMAGFVLTPLLPIAIMKGIDGYAFKLVFDLHCALLAVAAAGSVLHFVRLSTTNGLFGLLGLGASIVFALAAFALAGLPITDGNALRQELAVPAWWVARNAAYEIPWHEGSFFPMLINMGFTGLLALGAERLVHYYHWIYLIVLAGSVAAGLERLGATTRTAWWGGFFVLSTPVCLKLASVPMVELGTALFAWLTVYFLCLWSHTNGKIRHALEAGVAAGLTMSCRYSGLLFAVIACCAIVFLLARTRVRFLKLFAGTFIGPVAALAIVSPWYVKNLFWANNPLYPLLQSTAPQATGGFSDEIESEISPILFRKNRLGETPYDIALYPLRIFTEGRDGSLEHFDGVLSPLLLSGVIALAAWNLRRWVPFLVLTTLSYVVFAFTLGSSRIPYMSPVYGSLAALAAIGIGGRPRGGIAGHQCFQWGLLAIQILFTTLYLAQQLTGGGALNAIFGRVSSQSYLDKHLPEMPIVRAINRELPEKSRTYLLFTENPYYYFKRNAYAPGLASAAELKQWIGTSASDEDLARAVRAQGITHILLNGVKTNEEFRAVLDSEALAVWNGFRAEQLTQIGESNGFVLYAVRQPEKPPTQEGAGGTESP